MNIELQMDQESQLDQEIVRLVIESDPYTADLIFALITPLVYGDDKLLVYPAALPEAHIDLARRLNRMADWSPAPNWGWETEAFIVEFIEFVMEFDKSQSFNRLNWAEQFLDDLSEWKSTLDDAADPAMLHVIQIVVDLVGTRREDSDQKSVYLDSTGIPLPFKDWAERIMSGTVRAEVLGHAHFDLLDPGKMVGLLKKGNLSPDYSASADLPF